MSAGFNTLGVRTLSGALFVVLLLGSVLWNYVSFTVFFFIVALGSLAEFYRLSSVSSTPRPQRVAGFMSATVLYLLFIDTSALLPVADMDPYSLICVLPVIVFGAAIFDRSEEPLHGALYSMAGLVYCVVPFALLHLLPETPGGGTSWRPYNVVSVFLLIWTNDTFAYISGKLAGRRKLAERISPGKTWEGTLGGIIACFAASFLIRDYVSTDNSQRWIVLGIFVPIVATIGDLFESLLKRRAGAKDSGTIMPGHGGFLDRFDSLLFVSPFVVAVLRLLELN